MQVLEESLDSIEQRLRLPSAEAAAAAAAAARAAAAAWVDRQRAAAAAPPRSPAAAAALLGAGVRGGRGHAAHAASAAAASAAAAAAAAAAAGGGGDAGAVSAGGEGRPTLASAVIDFARERPRGLLDAAARSVALVLLEEHAAVVLSEGAGADAADVERCCAGLLSLVQNPPPPPAAAGDAGALPGPAAHLRCQALVTHTSLLLSLEGAASSHPLLFSAFLDSLLSIAGRVNRGADRLLRATAVQCLIEIEDAFPGVLGDRAPLILAWAEAERTHVAAAYLELLATVAEHAAAAAATASASASAAAAAVAAAAAATAAEHPAPPGALSPRRLPSFGGTGAAPHAPLAPHTSLAAASAAATAAAATAAALLPDTRKCVALLVDSVDLFTRFQTLAVLPRIVRLVHLCRLPTDSFRHRFEFALSHDPLVRHIGVFVTFALGGGAFSTQEKDMLVRRLCCTCADILAPPEERVLGMRWLRALPRAAVFPHRMLAFPTIFDPLEVVRARIAAFLCCFAEGDAPPSVLGVLGCVDGFRFDDPSHPLAMVAFDSLRLVFSRFPGLQGDAYRFACGVVLAQPAFQGLFVARVLDRCAPPLRLALHRWLETDLNALPAAALLAFLPLVASIVRERAVDCSRLVEGLHRCLRLRLRRRAPGELPLSWATGHALLAIARTVLCLFSTVRLFRPLGDLLLLLSASHPDVDIRERGFFYYQLLTHVSGEKIRRILSDRQSDEQTTALAFLSPSIGNARRSQARARRLDSDQSRFLLLLPAGRNSSGGGGGGSLSAAWLPAAAAAATGAAKRYWAWTRAPHFRPIVTKEYVVQHNSSFPAPPSSVLDAIYSVVLSFGHAPFYAPVDSVHIPHLRRPPPGAAPPARRRFPWCSRIVLTFSPTAPIPASFPVDVAFNDADGKVCVGALDPLRLRFVDLFLPMPWPPAGEEEEEEVCGEQREEHGDQAPAVGPGGQQGRDGAEWRAVFRAVWHSLGRTGDRVVKRLPHGPAQFARLWDAVLSPFSGDPAFSRRHRRAFVFLPPAFHLLLQGSASPGGGFTVECRSDFWRVFSCLDELFDEGSATE